MNAYLHEWKKFLSRKINAQIPTNLAKYKCSEPMLQTDWSEKSRMDRTRTNRGNRMGIC